jgi:hypothetical protein
VELERDDDRLATVRGADREGQGQGLGPAALPPGVQDHGLDRGRGLPREAGVALVLVRPRRGTFEEQPALDVEHADGVETEQRPRAVELAAQAVTVARREVAWKREQRRPGPGLLQNGARLVREPIQQVVDLVAAHVGVDGELVPALADEMALRALVDAQVEHDDRQRGQHHETGGDAPGIALEAGPPAQQEAGGIPIGGREGRGLRRRPAVDACPRRLILRVHVSPG